MITVRHDAACDRDVLLLERIDSVHKTPAHFFIAAELALPEIKIHCGIGPVFGLSDQLFHSSMHDPYSR